MTALYATDNKATRIAGCKLVATKEVEVDKSIFQKEVKIAQESRIVVKKKATNNARISVERCIAKEEDLNK